MRLVHGTITEIHITEAGEGVDVVADTSLTAEEQTELATQVTWMLGLNQDLASFHAQAREEPRLVHVIDSARGRILRSASVFEDTVKTILTTNTSWAGTKRMVAALVNRYGTPDSGDPARRAFPAPSQLAAVAAEELRAAGLGYRAPFVADLARGVSNGEIDLETLRHSSLTTPEIRSQLLAIKGIGPYAAANMLMLLGRYDFVPIDSWAKQMVSREWHDGAPVGPVEVEAAFEPWGEWQGLAYWFWAWDQE
jgi:3-methyladenine DNA glycosylase/8-oxoguanine DNA glycosylase